MHRLRQHLAAAALVCAPATAYAAGQDFTLVNRTGYQIDRVYVSASTERQWGGDAMPQSRLVDGERVSIGIPECARRCQWDLKVEYHDGVKATWSGLNLRDITRMSLFWNSKTKTTTAQAD